MKNIDWCFWVLADAMVPVTLLLAGSLAVLVCVGRHRTAFRDAVCRATAWLLLLSPLIGLVAARTGWDWRVSSRFAFPSFASPAVSPTGVARLPTQPSGAQASHSKRPAQQRPTDDALPQGEAAKAPGSEAAQPSLLPSLPLKQILRTPQRPNSSQAKPLDTLTNTPMRHTQRTPAFVGNAAPNAAPDVTQNVTANTRPQSADANAANTENAANALDDTFRREPYALLRFWAVVVWAVGVTILATTWIAGVIRIGWLLRRSYPLANCEVELPGAVVRVSDRLRSPAVVGINRPIILVPAAIIPDANENTHEDNDVQPNELLNAVLRHEHAHVLRRDPLHAAVARMTLTLGWLHPWMWLFHRRFQQVVEEMCDNHVVQHCSPLDYAQSLLTVAARLPVRGATPQTLSMFSKDVPLEGRVRRLLDDRTDFRAQLTRRSKVALLVVLTLAATLGGFGHWRPRSALAEALAWEPAPKRVTDTRRRRRARARRAREAKRKRPAPAPAPPPNAELLDSSLAYLPKDVVAFASSRNHGKLVGAFRKTRVFQQLAADPQWAEFFQAMDSAVSAIEIEDDDTFEELGINAEQLEADLQAVYSDCWRNEWFVCLDQMRQAEASWSESQSAMSKRFGKLKEKLEGAKAKSNGQATPNVPNEQKTPNDSLTASWADIDLRPLTKLKLPVLLGGARLKDPAALQAVKRLESCLVKAWPLLQSAMMEDAMGVNVRLEKVDGHLFWTTNVQGAAIPWGAIDRTQMTREQERALDDVVIAMADRRLTFAVGFMDDHLLFSIGEGVDHFKRFGKRSPDTRLVSHPDLAPLRAAAPQRLTHVAFIADDWLRVGSLSAPSSLVDWLKEIKINDQPLDLAAVSPIAQQVVDDLNELGTDLAPFVMPPSGVLVYQHWTEKGLEGELYWPAKTPGTPIHRIPPVLEVIGEKPLAVFAWEGSKDRQMLQIAHKWGVRGAWYARKYAALADPDMHQMMFMLLPKFLPHVRDLSAAMRDDVLASVGDGGSAVVAQLVPLNRQHQQVALNAIVSIDDPKRLKRGLQRIFTTAEALPPVAMSAFGGIEPIRSADGKFYEFVSDGESIRIPTRLPRPHHRSFSIPNTIPDTIPNSIRNRKAVGELYWYNWDSLDPTWRTALQITNPDDLRPPTPPWESIGEMTPLATGLPHVALTPKWLSVGSHSSATQRLFQSPRPFLLPTSLAPGQDERLTKLFHVDTRQLIQSVVTWAEATDEANEEELQSILQMWKALSSVRSYTATENQGDSLTRQRWRILWGE